MKLYDDVEPVRVQGYASVWNVVHFAPDPIRLLPGACDHVGLPVYATFGHDLGHEFADARNGSLAVWQDDYGVAFEAALPPAWNSLSLAQGIRCDNFREASCHWAVGRWSSVAEEPDGHVETVSRARLVEISIVPAGACPGTAVWLTDENPADLPPDVAQAPDRWHAGRMAARLAAARPRAQAPAQVRAKGRPTVPASVLRALARFGPRGA